MSQDFLPLNIAVMTASDTRTLEEDTSGQLLSDRLTEAGHQLAAREIVPDDIYLIRALVSQWIADESIDIVISTGGTGLTGRDGTPEAVEVLFDKKFRVLENYSGSYPMKKSRPPPSSQESQPVLPTGPTSSACQVPQEPAVRLGTAFWQHNSICAVNPVILPS